jgi:hypothetical protein
VHAVENANGETDFAAAGLQLIGGADQLHG